MLGIFATRCILVDQAVLEVACPPPPFFLQTYSKPMTAILCGFPVNNRQHGRGSRAPSGVHCDKKFDILL